MVSASVRFLFYQPMDENIKTHRTLCFPPKENPNLEKVLFDWPIVLQYDVKAKYRLISKKFSGIKFSHPSVCLTNQRDHARLSDPFDKPIKSHYFRSLVVSVWFARFHFKVIRKLFYLLWNFRLNKLWNDKITASNSCQKNVFPKHYFKRHKQPQKSFEKLLKNLFICAFFCTFCVISNFILTFWEDRSCW